MIIPYLNQVSQISIGKLTFKNVNNIEIKQSVNELSDTAVITLPRFFKKLNDKYPLDYIKYGDKVVINFGYKEFGIEKQYEGFVRYIGSDAPIVITCDQLYPLRQNNFVASFKTATLRQILTTITKGTMIKKVECPDVNLGKYLINNSSTYQVLEKIKEEFGFFVRVYGTVLHVGWAWDWRPGYSKKHIYHFQKNVKDPNGLTYQRKDAFNVRVRVKVRNAKGKASYVEVGSKEKNATVYTIDYAASSEKVAKQIADSRLKKSVYDGYVGNIKGFGYPIVNAGDSIEIINNREPYRQGTYLVESVSKEYGDGITMTNDLAFKI